jgi:succinyl-CoA synthetase alpha subunit
MIFTAHHRVLVQGITDALGMTHVPLMLAYGTAVVAGVSPGYGGEELEGVPIFDTVEQAIATVGSVEASVIFVPPYLALDAALEAMAAGIRQLILITEGVPAMDLIRLIRQAEATDTLLIGPTCPGVIVPGTILLGTHPTEFYTPGSVGIVSRSGTLTYEIALELTRASLGQSIAVGIGGDRIVGSSFQQWLQILDEDDATEVIVLVGEIGGDAEEIAARYIAETIEKPVIAYIAGRTAPRGRVMGHAGAIIAAQTRGIVGAPGTVERKIAAFRKAKIPVASRPSEIPALVRNTMTARKASPRLNSRNS